MIEDKIGERGAEQEHEESAEKDDGWDLFCFAHPVSLPGIAPGDPMCTSII
jgi:hypothetical protein